MELVPEELGFPQPQLSNGEIGMCQSPSFDLVSGENTLLGGYYLSISPGLEMTRLAYTGI